MKTDLVMWSKNGAYYLEAVLSQVDKVIPSSVICHKILVDDNSVDNTVNIAKDHGWEVYRNPVGGIPSGANEALRHVDQPFFVSLEQDVVLADDWWRRISRYMDNPKVACAEGMRVRSHPVLKALDTFQLRSVLGRNVFNPVGYIENSIDNNLFRTEVVRGLGGFPIDCPVCADTILRNRIVRRKYYWVVDPEIVSLHIRNNFWSSIEHSYKLASMCSHSSDCSKLRDHRVSTMIKILATSPLRGLQVALINDMPIVCLAYPLIRLYSIKAEFKWRGSLQY